MVKAYGEDGFVPTVEEVVDANGRRVYRTIDGRVSSDIVRDADGNLVRLADLADEEKSEALRLYEENGMR